MITIEDALEKMEKDFNVQSLVDDKLSEKDRLRIIYTIEAIEMIRNLMKGEV